MAKLELEIVGFNDAINSMNINGKKCKFKIGENRTRSCIIEADKAEIVIYKTHIYNGKCWFWWSLLYFIISIFGIFDVRQNARCLVVDCRFNINLEKDTKTTLKINNFEDGGRFADIESETPIELINNVQYFDKQAQKRHKKMKKARFAISFISIILIVLAIIFIKR